MKVYEYVNSLLSMLNNNNDNKVYDFSILCEKYPIMVSKGSFRARVLYVTLAPRLTLGEQANNERFYPNKLTEIGLEYITVTSNVRRRITMNAQEFWINGNTERQEYKGNEYYNYSIERTNNETKKMVQQLREKYNIPVPEIFIGKHHDLILN